MSVDNNMKQLDSYSALICSKFFEKSQDFINLICVNSKFKETTEKLRFNPIPITTLKLFPKIQTQYLYSKYDTKIEGINNYEILFEITYDQYLKYKQSNVKFRYIVYTRDNRKQYGDTIPENVNILGKNCFGTSNQFMNDASDIKEIDISSNVIILGEICFSYCRSLKTIDLPLTLTSIGEECFSNCKLLSFINLPSTIQALGYRCFNNCTSLTSINLPSLLVSLGNYCFYYCESLTSINLPLTIQSLGIECFAGCSSLKTINLPSSLTLLGDGCFRGCNELKGVIKVPESCYHFNCL